MEEGIIKKVTVEVDDTTEFTSEELAAAAAIIIGVVRDMAKRGNDQEETCGRCQSTTKWSEAMYDLLAECWVCPGCWDNGVE